MQKSERGRDKLELIRDTDIHIPVFVDLLLFEDFDINIDIDIGWDR